VRPLCTIQSPAVVEIAGRRTTLSRRGIPAPPPTWSADMEYMLLIYSDPNGFDKLPASQQAEGLAAYGAYHDALN
jgi:hypothetical protein